MIFVSMSICTLEEPDLDLTIFLLWNISTIMRQTAFCWCTCQRLIFCFPQTRVLIEPFLAKLTRDRKRWEKLSVLSVVYVKSFAVLMTAAQEKKTLIERLYLFSLYKNRIERGPFSVCGFEKIKGLCRFCCDLIHTPPHVYIHTKV